MFVNAFRHKIKKEQDGQDRLRRQDSVLPIVKSVTYICEVTKLSKSGAKL